MPLSRDLTPSSLSTSVTLVPTQPAPTAELRVLSSTGRVVDVSLFGRHTATFVTCSWLVEFPSGHPEPDFHEGLWTTVECGAPVFSLDGSLDHTTCANGHRRHIMGSSEWEADMEAFELSQMEEEGF